jgi:formamidopyrimidine-DNA glycosylase
VPELPEVETVCRGLAPHLVGRCITDAQAFRPDLRFPFPEDFTEHLRGRRIDHIARRAKYILIRLSDDRVWLTHLGMTGSFALIPPENEPPLTPHTHLRIGLDDGWQLLYSDPRRFGFMDLFAEQETAAHPRLAALGPEPLGNAFDAGRLMQVLAGKRVSIKVALLDQSVVAGLGNIYVSEALFMAGISPLRRACDVTIPMAERLAHAIRSILEAAIAAGGSTLRDFTGVGGELGYFQHRFHVYDRQGASCPQCACDCTVTGGIRRIVQAGRSTFFCPQRQE